MIINNTGKSSVKVFCESACADINLGNSRKVWSLRTPIVVNHQINVKMLCSVESCSIPLSYYTINQTNNRIKIGDTVYEVPPGNYSSASVVDELNSRCPIDFRFERTKSKFILKSDEEVTIGAVPHSIYDLLGIEEVTFEGEYTAPRVCNLIYTTGIYVSLNNIANDNIDFGSENQSSTCLLRLPVTQPTNTYLQFFNPLGFKNLLSTTVLNQIDISLLDDKRELLQLTSNVNWTVVLRIDFEKSINETTEETKIQQFRLKSERG